MTADVSAWLVAWSVLALPLLVATHILLYRAGFRPAANASPQAFLARLIVSFNVPVLAVAGLIGGTEGRPVGEILLMGVFVLGVYNCAAYAYFHVFNMSETARRVRMLLYLHELGGADKDSLLAFYSPKDMIDARLGRLVEMRQISLAPDGRYRISGKLLPWAAHLIEGVRHIFGYDRVAGK
jgi:hypothetical protein